MKKKALARAKRSRKRVKRAFAAGELITEIAVGVDPAIESRKLTHGPDELLTLNLASWHTRKDSEGRVRLVAIQKLCFRNEKEYMEDPALGLTLRGVFARRGGESGEEHAERARSETLAGGKGGLEEKTIVDLDEEIIECSQILVDELIAGLVGLDRRLVTAIRGEQTVFASGLLAPGPGGVH